MNIVLGYSTLARNIQHWPVLGLGQFRWRLSYTAITSGLEVTWYTHVEVLPPFEFLQLGI